MSIVTEEESLARDSESGSVDSSVEVSSLTDALHRLRFTLAFVLYILPVSVGGALGCVAIAAVCVPLDVFLMSVCLFTIGPDLSQHAIRAARRCLAEIRVMHTALLQGRYNDMSHWFW